MDYIYYEESGYSLDLDLLTNISYESHVSYPRRSGILRKHNHSRPIYLTNPCPNYPRPPLPRKAKEGSRASAAAATATAARGSSYRPVGWGTAGVAAARPVAARQAAR